VVADAELEARALHNRGELVVVVPPNLREQVVNNLQGRRCPCFKEISKQARVLRRTFPLHNCNPHFLTARSQLPMKSSTGDTHAFTFRINVCDARHESFMLLEEPRKIASCVIHRHTWLLSPPERCSQKRDVVA
jgi:hypothetical protein